MNTKRKAKLHVLRQAITSLLVPLILLAGMPTGVLATELRPTLVAPPSVNEALSATQAVNATERAAMVRPFVAKLFLPSDPSDADIESARIFHEPLIPMHTSPVRGENPALAKALSSFKTKNDKEDVSDLTAFIERFPNSRWRASLALNIGLLRFETGYLTGALSLWASAWQLSKEEKGLAQQSVAERAVSELVQLDARLGRIDDLKRHISELRNRSLHGSSAERLDAAKQGLFAMEHSPGTSFKCGPFAVNTLLFLGNPSKGIDPRLKAVASTQHGTNLAQVKRWADMVGLHMQMAKRGNGAALIVPSIMHWKVGHFAAMTAENRGRYRLQDPTFDSDGNLWITQQAIDNQSDGYFLIPEGQLPQGWHKVPEAEALTVWGKGNAQNRNENKCPGQPNKCPGMMCCGGMAQASAWTMQAELNITDTPLSYSQPIGPLMNFSVNYSQNEENQPSSFTFTNLGAWWTLNWVSWLTVDSSNNVTVHVRGGGDEIYNYSLPDNVSNPYPPNLYSQAVLAITGDGVYQRQLPDGSIEVFSLSDGSGNNYLTQVIDPQGNAATINYDTTHFRVTSITDANGNNTTVNYVSNTVGNSGYYLVSSLADPFGRTASFAYDSTNTYLTSITDAVGNVSQFVYAPNSSFIDTLITPYGTTSFYSYTPLGTYTYPPRGLRFTFPDGTSSVVENWIGETKTSYFWDREAISQYPLDPGSHIYTHSTNTKFLFDPSTNNEAAVVNYQRPPLEAPIQYTYLNESNLDNIGTINLPATVTRSLSGNLVEVMALSGTVTAGDVISLTVTDSALTGGPETISYTAKTGDSLSSIASGVAAAVNTDPVLPNLGITATSSGSTVHIQSLSFDSTTYSSSLSSGATESVSLYANGTSATVGGSITVGDTVSLTVSDSGLTGGQETVSYQVHSGDTLAAIAAGLAAAINIDGNLNGLGVTASAAGTTATVQSLSVNHTTYSKTDGATETISLGSVNITQAWNYQYNAFGHMTQAIDPLGRTFSYLYSANNVDLLEVRETKSNDNFLLGKWEYNTQHVPVLMIDGSGQHTQISYNAFGEPTSVTDALNNIRTRTYTSTENATIGGTVTSGNVLSVTVTDATLTSGQETVSYTVVAGDTLTSIATHLASNFNADSNLSSHGFSATSSSTIFTMTGTSPNATSYSKSVTGTETITLSHVTFGFLAKIDGPLAGNQDIIALTWNNSGTLKSQTDAEGYTLTFSYDNLDRLTKTSFPDGTSDQTTYQNLDPVFLMDRLGRTTTRTFDAMDQLVSEVDPLGRNTQYSWCACGSLSTLTDGAGHVTTWNHDLEGRVIQKVYQDNTQVNLVYEPTTSRLQSRADALNQTTFYNYNADNTLAEVAYRNAVNPTSNVYFEYDQKFARLLTAQNGWGSDSYVYNPYVTDPFVVANVTLTGTPVSGSSGVSIVFTSAALSGGQYTFSYTAQASDTTSDLMASHVASNINSNSTLSNAGISAISNGSTVIISAAAAAGVLLVSSSGANGVTAASSINTGSGMIQSASNSVIPNSQITYQFDALGRPTDRSINGSANSINWSYDAISRITSEGNALGTFNFTYVNDVAGSSKGDPRLLQVGYPNGQTTNFSYYSPSFDERLKQINNLTGSLLGISQFNYAFDAAGEITSWSQQQTQHKPSYLLGYDAAGQLIAAQAGNGAPPPNYVRQFYFSYDNAANRTASQRDSIQNIAISGSVTVGNTLTVTVNDSGLTGGSESVTYSVQSGDSLSSIATNLAATISADSNLQAIGVNATANGTTINVRSLSPNITTYSLSTSGGATETLTAGINKNQENVTVGGTITAGDVLKVNVYDGSFTSNPQVVSYIVQTGDTTTTVAQHLAAGFASLGSNGYFSASSSGPVITVQTTSPNVSNFTNGSGTVTETLALAPVLGGAQTLLIGGTVTTNDVLTLTVQDIGLSNGSESVSHTVATGETLSQIASALASAVNTDSNLMNIGVTASASGATVTLTSSSVNATTYLPSKSSSATETLTAELPPNGTVTAAIGGTATAGDSLTVTVYDAALAGGSHAVTYTVAAGNTPNAIAQGLASAIANDASLQAVGVTASSATPTSSVSVVNITSTSENATTYTTSLNAGATETLALSSSVGASQFGFNNVNELTSISAGGAVRFRGNTDRPAQPVTMNGGGVNATMLSAQNFRANPVLSSGMNAETVSATSGGGTNTTNTYEVSAVGPSSKSLSYDVNGNMTSDGTNTYAWDAENRLIQITYPGANNYTNFTVDALGRCVKIVETTSGSVTSTKQFVWCGNERCEVRDGSGNLLNQYLAFGQVNFSGGTGTSYFYATDHLGSAREMTDSTGAVQSDLSYDPYGRATQLSGSMTPDAQFCGYYTHARSGLNLTRTRVYSSNLGRFISRDPLATVGSLDVYSVMADPAESVAEPSAMSQPKSGLAMPRGLQPPSLRMLMGSSNAFDRLTKRPAAELVIGANLYAYCDNTPISLTDPLGLMCHPNDDPCAHCDDEYDDCIARCRKLKTPRERAICYAKCADDYARCLAGCR